MSLAFARQVGDLNKFDGAKFEGTWELIYSTSVKWLCKHLPSLLAKMNSYTVNVRSI